MEVNVKNINGIAYVVMSNCDANIKADIYSIQEMVELQQNLLRAVDDLGDVILYEINRKKNENK